MGKFGKKVEIQLNPLAYNIGLLGESGIGKSTLMKEVCEKLVGPDGYIAFDIGKEDGHGAIDGIVSEKIENWAKFTEVTDDIIENKTTDYPDLKVIILDTYDQLCDIAEREAIRLYNKKNSDKPKAETINQAWGGFGNGLDKTIELILDRLWELKQVGVAFIIIAHTKKKDVDDPVTGEQFSILTSNISQKYFNAIKTKLHVLGLAYIDREIVKEKTGKKNLKTGADIMKGKVAAESRVISFRDDTYSVDSKSRFAHIVDQISFDADEFIKALQDAILAEHAKSGVPVEETRKKQAAEALEREKEYAEVSEIIVETKVDEDENEKLLAVITEKFGDQPDDVKAQAKARLNGAGFKKFTDPDIPTKILKEIAGLMK